MESFTVKPLKVFQGDRVECRYKLASGQPCKPSDWLGLFEVDADNKTYKLQQPNRSARKSDNMWWTINFEPNPEKEYEFRYFPNNSYDLLGKSEPFKILKPVHETKMMIDFEAAETDTNIIIKWEHVEGSKAKSNDWIGLFEVTEEDNKKYKKYESLRSAKQKGDMNFRINFNVDPNKPDYEFRYFFNNGYDCIGKSKVFPITKKVDVNGIKRKMESLFDDMRIYSNQTHRQRINSTKGDLGDLYQQNKAGLEKSEAGRKVLEMFMQKMEEADKYAEEKFMAQDCDKYIREANNALSYATSYANNNPKRAFQYLGEAYDGAKPLLMDREKYSKFEKVAKFLKEYDEKVPEIEERAKKLQVKEQITYMQRPILSEIQYLQSYINQGHIVKLESIKENVLDSFGEFLDKFSEHELAKKTIEEVNEALNKIDIAIPQIKEKNEVEKVMREGNRLKDNLRPYLNQKAVERVKSIKDDLMMVVDPIRGKYPENEKLKKFLDEIDELLHLVEEELGALIIDLEVTKLMRPAIKCKEDLEHQLKVKSVERASESRKNLEEAVAELRVKYPEYEKSKNFLQQVDKLLSTVEEELGEMIKQREITKYSRLVQSSLDSVQPYINQRAVQRVLALKEELISDSQWLRKYPKDDKAQKMVEKVDATLEKIQKELGEMIATLAIDKIAPHITDYVKKLEHCINSKSLNRIQIYQKELQEYIERLEEYDKWEKAQVSLKEGKAMITRLTEEMGDLLAAKEIDSHKNKITNALKLFTIEIEKPEEVVNYDQVLSKKEYLIECIAPIKEKYSEHTLAQDLLTSVNEALDKCEQSIGPKIAKITIDKIVDKITPLRKLFDETAKSGNKQGASTYLQKILIFIYPLRIQYPGEARDMLHEYDQLYEEYPAELTKFQLNEINNTIDGLQKEWESNEDKQLNGNFLVTINRKSAKIRKSYLYYPKVSDFCLILDFSNYAVTGRIPNQEEIFPIFEVSWRTPGGIRTPLNDINERSKKINNFYDKYRSSMEKLDLTGATQYSDYILKKFKEIIQNIEKLIDYIKNALEKLKKEDANHPAVSLTEQALLDLDNKLREMNSSYAEKCNYAIRMSKIYNVIMKSDDLIKDGQSISDNAEHSVISVSGAVMTMNSMEFGGPKLRGLSIITMWPTIIEWFDHGLGKVKEVAKLRPDNHPECDFLTDVLINSKILAEEEYKSVTKKYITKSCKNESYKYALKHLDAFKKNMPKEESDIKKFTEIYEKEKKLAEERRQRIEEERKRKIEEEKQRLKNIADKLEEEWLKSYADGVIETPTSGNWKYTADGNLKCTMGTYVNLHYRWEKRHNNGNMVCVTVDDKGGKTGWINFDGSKIIVTSPHGRVYVCSMEGTNLLLDKLSNAKDLYAKTVVSGNPPPPVVLFCVMFTKCQEWIHDINVEWERRKREQEEKERRNKFMNDKIWNYGSCKVCHRGQNNIRGCMKCKAIWCSDCIKGNSYGTCPYCHASVFDVAHHFM
ncbi:calcium-binding and coiled-coil domain-containing protein [Anaeramoeba flamelloides]|uniref:Calcium-binding and coiled-coil domain-containing protein n=1 Tax=Anaeramoeba flamelloides TaxID=1746091 RepID=A0AAV7ZQF9_9EUKA|nr:calcium-binding and coiled-coil domain-containing protein [Anaeramoeba flamelloides]